MDISCRAVNVAGFVFLCLIWTALARLVAVTALSLWSLRRGVAEPAGDLADVTILIPARDEAAVIAGVLAQTRLSLAQGARLVVIDDGSTDATNRIAAQALEGFPQAQLITLPQNQGKAQALNHGLARVATPFVLTIDADTRVSPQAVGLALARLQRATDADVVAFDVCVPPGQGLFAEVQGVEYDAALNFERRGQSVVSAVSVAPGAASLWRTDALARINGFADATVTEDVDATLALAALGCRAVHVAGAMAWTDPPRNLRHLLAQRRRWSLGHYQNLPRHLPRRSDAAAFRWAVWPNFAFLCLFLPMLALTALAMLILGTGGHQGAIWTATAIWLPLVYGQRLLGLWVAGRRSHPLAILIEPFSTTALHGVAAVMVLGFWLRARAGRPQDAWGIRD